MRLSIAMCTFNGSRYLAQQLESILSQTKLPDELVICDDNSTDNTLEIIRNIIQKSPFRIRLIVNSENNGSTKNFEQAIKFCNGEIIVLCDQDDVWMPNKLKMIEEVFESNPKIGYVFSNAELVDKDLHSLGKTLWDTVGFRRNNYYKFEQGEQFEVLIRKNYITGATAAFRIPLKDYFLPISENWVHDGWIAILSSALGRPGCTIQESLVKYRQHNGQQMGADNNNFLMKLKDNKTGGNTNFPKELAAFCDLKCFLLRLNEVCNINLTKELRLVDGKIQHIENRIKIHSLYGLKRWYLILKEAQSGNYHRFSNSWRSIGKDILYKHNFLPVTKDKNKGN